MARRVKRTRNGGTWTESQYFSAIRSALRHKFRYWKPATDCKLAARREYTGSNRRQKWEYQCNACKGWFPEKSIQIDHVQPAGSLKSLDDVAGFIERLTPENESGEDYQVLCLECHQLKTNEERKK